VAPLSVVQPVESKLICNSNTGRGFGLDHWMLSTDQPWVDPIVDVSRNTLADANRLNVQLTAVQSAAVITSAMNRWYSPTDIEFNVNRS
jgi:hypothetical protein